MKSTDVPLQGTQFEMIVGLVCLSLFLFVVFLCLGKKKQTSKER